MSLLITAKDDVHGASFGCDLHELFDFLALSIHVGADVNPEGRICLESHFEVIGKFLFGGWILTDEILPGAVDADDVAVRKIGWNSAIARDGQFDVHLDLLLRNLGCNHKEDEEEKRHVDHWGQLKPHFVLGFFSQSHIRFGKRLSLDSTG